MDSQSIVIPNAGEPPLARLKGIQFGLMTTGDIYKLSVDAVDNPITKRKELEDPKLGLPIAKGTCTTCNAESSEQCQGHFGHILLPLPIFHPNHVTKLVTVLRLICLNCGQLRKKKAGKFLSLLAPGLKKEMERNATLAPKVEEDVSTPTERPRRARTPLKPVDVDDDDDDDKDYKFTSSAQHKKRRLVEVEKFLDTEARVSRKEAEESEPVIFLSSDDEDLPSSSRKQANVQVQSDAEDDEKAPNTSALGGRVLRKRKDRPNSNGNGSANGSVVDLTETYDPIAAAKYGKRKRTDQLELYWHFMRQILQRKYHRPLTVTSFQPRKAGAVVAEKKSKPARGKCKYCSGTHSEKYPNLLIKTEVETGKDGNPSKTIRMEFKVKQTDIDSVASDYWSFVDGKKKPSKNQTSVKKSRLLLPSEALIILKKIPESAFKRLGMMPKVAPPEALIMECIPVPPNCMRMQDDPWGSSNMSFKQGIDRATTFFSSLMGKIEKINKTRFSQPAFEAAAIEACNLQSLFGLYLREKGAPKPVPGKEKKRIDHGGRVQKRDSRWSMEWLRMHVLGKRSCYTARDVLTGDPYLKADEIGIPQKIAKVLTIPERVNKLNRDKLQECVNNGQSLVGRYRACGAVSLLRGTEKFMVTRKTSHELLIGDIVHRHLMDGDLVYVNRPPSLHKHSLLALRVHVQDISTLSINPATCAPMHADFDGDCIHVFVPQSEETKAEQHALMTIPAQLLPSPEQKTIMGMSQDNILATHLLTSTASFLNKEDMFQMGMWSTRSIPIPTIVKSGRGPIWTGQQVFDITIPKGFSFRSADDSVKIQDGELVYVKDNWLTSTIGLMHALARDSPSAAVNHLDCSQSVLREWLLSRGFSVSLRDFYAAPDHKSRKKMIEDLGINITRAENMAVNKELLFDEKFQKLEAIQSDMAPAGDPKHAEVLEDIAVGFFQQQFSEIGVKLGSEISLDNQLLAMVRSGSKGTLSKVLQQIGSLGLQLCKGEHLLKSSGNAKLISLAASTCCKDTWEARGLVQRSLFDGLNPLEFFLHSIAVRAGTVNQTVGVTESGELFKNLMLFLRDVHVAYDGTVRNKSGLEIIQFSYNGVKTTMPTDDTAESNEWNESVMPGEAVGILAATAISQPAYGVMLEANHNVGSKKMRPFELLQGTIKSRSATKLNRPDRKATLRLKPCLCNISHCEEKRALKIQDELQPVSVEMIAKATSIQYVPESSSEWDSCREAGVRLPWVGHIQFDRKALIQTNLKMENIVSGLDTEFQEKSYKKVMGSGRLIKPIFFFRTSCDSMDREFGPCLHFSASLQSKNTKRMVPRSKVSEFVESLRDVMMPLILKTVVKGDERIESAKLVWEDAAWSPCGVSDDGERMLADPNGELVVEVLVKERSSTTRGSAWSIMKEACALNEYIDWRRSSPYSVQEIRHALGVEAARDCILQRLTLATKAAGSPVDKTHLKLVSDLMVHSGDVNAINSFGYTDLMKSLGTSAPFTAGAFREPIKTFMAAGEKGEQEELSGVLATSIFGTRAPVGTGAHFDLQLGFKGVADNLQLPVQSVDIMDCLGSLNCKIKEEFPETPVAVEDIYAQDTNPYDNANGMDGAWGGSSEDAGGWGASPGGEVFAKRSDAEEGGWGEPSRVQANGWGGAPSKDTDGGWDAGNAGGEGMEEDGGGWGAPAVHASKEKVSKKISADEHAWGEPSPNARWGDPLPADDSNAWTSGPSKDVPVANGHGGSTSARVEVANGWDSDTAANGGGWGAEQNPAAGLNADAWGAEQENPAASDGWDVSEQPQDAQETGGWGHSSPEALPRSDNFRRESSGRPSRRDEPREFQPTGANTIPLGKIRQFGPKPVGGGTDSVSPVPTPMSLDAPVLGTINNGGTDGSPAAGGETLDSSWANQEDKLESNWDVPDLDTIGPVSDWSLTAVQGGVPDSGWDTLDSQPSAHSNPSFSPRIPYGQNGLGRAGGSSAPRRISAVDDKADSEDWREIVEIVRAVRNILQTYEPEQRLNDVDHHVLMTQVLPHHPSSAKKIGVGVDFFKVAHFRSANPSDRQTKCFYIVRVDGSQDDFSYHKCLQTMASKKNPPLTNLYGQAFNYPQRR